MNVVFTFAPSHYQSMIPSARITKYVSQILSLTIADTPAVADMDIDVLLIVNGAFGFAKDGVLEALGAAVEKARHVVWIQNDYTIRIPRHNGKAESPFRKAFRNRYSTGQPPVDFWSTVEYMTKPGVSRLGRRLVGEGSRYINWNCLTVDELNESRPTDERLHGDVVCYYGSYREYREPYFDRYFRMHRDMVTNGWELHVSSPSKKFGERYGDVVMVEVHPKWDPLAGHLEEYGMGLYIEDRQTHNEYMSPANRFYEMLSVGLPMAFQPECWPTFRQAEYDVRSCIASDSSALWKLFARRDELAVMQREQWYPRALAERQALDDVVRDAWRSLS